MGAMDIATPARPHELPAFWGALFLVTGYEVQLTAVRSPFGCLFRSQDDAWKSFTWRCPTRAGTPL